MPAIIGFDTETMEGPPITVQFYSEHLPTIDACIFVTEENVVDKTLRHLAKHCKHGIYTLYGHNLKFDLLSIFYPKRLELVKNKGAFDFTHRDWQISGVYGPVNFCILRRKNVEIFIVDGFSWFRSSLARAAQLICPELPKLAHPKGLGTTQFRAGDTAFVAYAMRDAQVSYHVGAAVDKIHEEFELHQCLSVADMASRIFTQHYIHESAPIWNVGTRILPGAVASYHGGKNNVVPGAAPAWHSHVDAWDLSSAYPHAMTEMPACSKPNLFIAARVFSNRARHYPDHGVYCVSGEVRACDWPVLFDAEFKPIRGKFANAWITGYEINEARRADEVKISHIFGHIYDTDSDPVTDTGLQRYVKDFYALKSNASNEVHRYLYKVLLNSLYGKFIQSHEIEPDGPNGVRWKHGPLYHPFLASLITGHTRAVVHHLEHDTNAIHTATDGIFCGERDSPKNGRFPWAPASGIGAIESEGKDMELCLARNKLYLLYSKNSHDGWKSFVRPDRYVVKYAKHGLQASVPDFEEMMITGRREYEVNKPNTLKTAIRQKRIPNKFEVRKIALNVAPITVHYNHERRGKNHVSKESIKESHRKIRHSDSKGIA